MDKKDLSIVIPCFNEAEGIRHLVSRLNDFEENFKTPHELVFVDDGSTDSTYEELVRFYGPRRAKDVKIIRHEKNKGVGGALKTGIANASGEYIAAIDSDCTYDLNYLSGMSDIIRKEGADMITASPYHPEGDTSGVPGMRLFLSRGLSNLYNFILGSRFHTFTSMFRIYKSEAIKNLNFESDGFMAMAEIFIKAHKKGLKIIEYPAVLKGRTFGASSARVLRVIGEHLGFIAKLVFTKNA